MNNPEKEFLKTIDHLCRRHQRHKVFEDFVTMASSALIVRQSPQHAVESEADYMACVPRYERDELEEFGKLLAITQIALNARFCDFLGSVFMQAEVSNSHLGQFFTPYELSYASAKMLLHDRENKPGQLITVQEPACGSGGMVIAFAQAAAEIGIDYHWDTYTVAVDISEVAARMAYIQLSLLDIPAHVVWGDTLRMTERRAWPTMAYWGIIHKVNRWRRGEANEPFADRIEQEPEPTPAPTSQPEPLRLVQAAFDF